VLLPVGLAVALLAAFVFVEARISEAPLVPLSIFRLRQLRTANLVVVLMYAALFSMFFFVTLYLQQVLHYDALRAGLGFLPITLSVFAASTLAPRLVERFGKRRVVTAGMLSAMGGLLLLTGVRVDGSYAWPVLPAGIMCGLGMGLGLVASTIAAVQGVPGDRSGLASGLLNTSRLFGGALGLAALSTIATANSHPAVGESGVQAQTNGFAIAFWTGAAICVFAALLAAVGLREQPAVPAEIGRPSPAGEEAEPEPLAA